MRELFALLELLLKVASQTGPVDLSDLMDDFERLAAELKDILTPEELDNLLTAFAKPLKELKKLKEPFDRRRPR